MTPEMVLIFMLCVTAMLGGIGIGVLFLYTAQRENNRTLKDVADILRTVHGLPSPKLERGSGGVPLKAIFISLIVIPCVWGGSPNAVVGAIHKDLEGVSPADRPYVRYLSIYHIHSNKDRLEYRQVTDFALNSLSRNRVIYRVIPVDAVTDGEGKILQHATLFRFDLRWYQFPKSVWEKLLDSEVYFHRDGILEKVKDGDVPTALKETPVEYEWQKVEWEGGDWKNADGTTTYYPKGAFTYQKRVPKVPPQVAKNSKETVFPGSWVDAAKWGAIVKATQSECPVVRADWFIVQTFQQEEREVGYYDFLQIKNRDDVDELALLNRDQVTKALEDVRGIIPISNVAVNNRQVMRLGTARGGYWFTLDAVKQKRRRDNFIRNAQRNLDKVKHDAEEIYFILPNRLFGLFAGDAKGNRQDSVPPNVACDTRTFVGNDTRIHPRNCIFCHKEGLRPLDSWSHRLIRVDNIGKLVGPIPKEQERLKALYLSDLNGELKLDQDRYAKALWQACELKPAEAADLFLKVHKDYLSSTLGVEEVARELGVEKAHLIASLKKYALHLQKTKGYGIDPALVGLLADPQEKMRREYFEEVFTQANDVVMGLVFVGEPYKEVIGPPKP